MSRKTHLLWNLGASLIAAVVLISAAGRLKAYFQATPGQAESSPAASTRQAARGEESSRERTSEGQSKEESGGMREEIFLWVNFLILAAGFWYLGKKYLGPYLEVRGQAIRDDMKRSRQALEDASRRLSGIEEKLQRLDEEIGALRNSALQEAAAEQARIEEAAKADARKIASAAEQEIASAAKTARQELKVYAAELAVGLAEKKLRDTISSQAEKGIFRSFLGDLGGNGGKS